MPSAKTFIQFALVQLAAIFILNQVQAMVPQSRRFLKGMNGGPTNGGVNA